MEMTQTVSNPTGTQHDAITVGEVDGMVLLATIWIELKPERVQESLAAGDAATLSLQLAIHQSQTVTFGLSGSGLTITFNNGINNNGVAAPAA
jgi:hypothetical protein